MAKAKPIQGRIKGAPEIVAAEEMLAAAIVAWFDEMLAGYVNDPQSLKAKLLVMDAFAIAVRKIAERELSSQAILKHLKDQL